MKRPSRILLPCVLALLLLAGGMIATHAQGGQLSLEDATKRARDAGISDETLNRLLLLGYEKQVDPETVKDLLGILTLARQEGFPPQPFLSKIEEGFIKRVPAPSIERVLSAKLDDYRYMRERVGKYLENRKQTGPLPPEYAVRLTESLHAGLSRQEMDRILHDAPASDLPMLTRGVEVYASLKKAGVDPKLSEEILHRGLRQAYFTPEQRDFARVVYIAKARGATDDRIASAAFSAIESGASVLDLGAMLGVTSNDLSSHGPQVGGSHSGSDHGGTGKTGMGQTGTGHDRTGEIGSHDAGHDGTGGSHDGGHGGADGGSGGGGGGGGGSGGSGGSGGGGGGGSGGDGGGGSGGGGSGGGDGGGCN